MATPGVDAVFAALADPTRRNVLDELSRRGPLNATQLAEGFPVTRQAVAKHLGALSEAGLVTARRQGREVRYEVVTPSLEEAVTWLTDVGSRWDHRLAALSEHLTLGSADTGPLSS